jgi:hypothetical protein
MKLIANNAAVLAMVLMFAISGCDNKSSEAKKLGFSSVQEMEEIHSKGWHTKSQYEEDSARQLGYKSAADMKIALAREKQEKERLENEAKLAEQKRKEMAGQCQYNLASVMYDYAFNGSRISGAVEEIGFYLAAAKMVEKMELDKEKQINERTQIQAAGVADFNGRPIPACVEKLTLNLVNRFEGKRSQACYMLGYLYDKEFGMYRKMKVAECKEFDINAWKNSVGASQLN